MSRKFSLEAIEIDGYYFINHEGLLWHSGQFWHNEKQLKKVYNNGSLSIMLYNSKIGIKKLRTQARKCKIKIEKNKCPF